MKNLLFFFVFLLTVSSCAKERKLEWALKQAGENRKQLEHVLVYYKDDPQKLAAARYLIENMPYHMSVREYFLSPEGDEFIPDLRLFASKEEIQSHCDSLVRLGYMVRKQRISDIRTLTADQVIENIELAFHVWETPWAKDVSFDDFCHYILPYRATTELYSALRREIMERFLPLLEKAQPENAFEACRIINEELKEVVHYGKTGSPLNPTIEDAYYSGRSECEGMCNLGIFVMRAVGIPVTVDYTVWVKMSLAHYWGAVLYEGKFHPFGPAEDHPGEFLEKTYATYQGVAAKVYRFRHAPFLPGKKYNDPLSHFLKNPRLKDVTHEYPAPVIDFTVEADKETDNRTVPVYACAINQGIWEIIAIGERQGKTCRFENIVGNNLFIVKEATTNGGMRYLTAPFHVDSVGNIHKFIPQPKEVEPLFTHIYYEGNGRERSLQYWDIEKEIFIELRPDQVTDTTKSYTQIPKNVFLKYSVAHTSLARPFMIRDGVPVHGY